MKLKPKKNMRQLKSVLFLSAALVVSALILSSCLKDKITQTYTVNLPIYKTIEEVRSEIKFTDKADIQQPGRIVFYNNFIFINEVNKGVHIIDNSNPSSPVVDAFLNVPGNRDIAVKDNVLYLDCYADLVAIDLVNFKSLDDISFVSNVFEYPLPEYNEALPIYNVDYSQGVVVGFEQQEITIDVDANMGYCGTKAIGEPNWRNFEGANIDQDINFVSSSTSSGSGATNSISASESSISNASGSLSRFMIYQNYLYTIANSWTVIPFDISDAMNPSKLAEVYGFWNIETLRTMKDVLMVGATNGVFFYSLDNPAAPVYVSQFTHVEGCDPVVSDGKYAYSTVRSGNGCGAIEDQLNVIDITSLANPQLVHTEMMQSPYGLDVDPINKLLFVCEGDNGLKIFDNSNPLSPVFKSKINVSAVDVIALGAELLVIGNQGFYQFSYTASGDINELSMISKQ